MQIMTHRLRHELRIFYDADIFLVPIDQPNFSRPSKWHFPPAPAHDESGTGECNN